LTIGPAPAITFTGTVPATATWNAAYTGSASATGGAGALTYSIASGALPTGLQLNATTGAITGTPTATGTFTFTVKAADAFGDMGSQPYTIVVTYPAIVVTPATLPVGYVGSNYTQTTLSATGGSGTGYNFALATGSSLPPGLNLSASGAITGKPTTTGNTTFTVKVTDSASNTGTGTFSIMVNAGVSITTATTLPVGYVGGNYSQTFAATGGSGTGYTWAVSSGSTIPAGLTLSAAGVLGGKPSTAGTPSFSITVTDSAQNSASATFTLNIAAGVSIATPTTLPGGYQGTAYPGATLAATGGTGTGYTWTWAAASGSTVPAGLNLSAGGAISGTPSASGTFSVVITVTDSAQNSASATFSLTVESVLTVTTNSTMKSGTINAAYSQSLAASGGSGSGYTWTTNTAGTTALAGINLSLNSAGIVSGTPLATGTATFAVTVTDSQSHTATATLTITVYASLTITSSTLPATNVGIPYSQTLAAAGGTGTGYTWTATSSNLATYGLSLSSTGVVSGTPTTAGTASFTANVTDSGNNTALAPLSITIYSSLTLPAPDPGSLPGTATTGVAYSGSINGSGGSGNYCYTVTGLPSDSLSSPAPNSPCGYIAGSVPITGTPASAQTVTFNVKMTDTTTNASVTQNGYSIVVSNPTPLTLPATDPSTLPSATVSQTYTGTISAVGGVGPTYTWTVNSLGISTPGASVTLGDGLSATTNDNNTLTITGMPTATQTVSFTVEVTDSQSHTAGPTTYTIVVNAAGSQVSGQFFLQNYCSNGSSNLPVTFTVGLYNGSTLVQSATTDVNGNYGFSNIANGTYSIQPSLPGAATLFYPASYPAVTLNNGSNNNVQGQNFNANVGFTVSGNLTYSGSQTGQTYLVVNNNNCGGNGGTGASITEAKLTSGGAFTIHGVPPGSNTISAWMDPLGKGVGNAIDPTGSTTVTVDANVSNADFTMADPTFTTPSENPTISTIIPNSQGVLIEGSGSKNSNGVEDANQYVIQWSTSSTLGGGSGGGQFASIAGSYTFRASGKNGVWILNNAVLTGSGYSFTSGQTYYFQARSFNTLDAANPHPSGWCNYTSTGCSGITGFTGVTIGTPACTGTCTAVSSSVTIPSGITINAGAPLYLGMIQLSGAGGNPTGIYVTEIASPVNGANAFTVSVPSGSNYGVIGILDQYKTGGIGAGTVTNVRDNVIAQLTISGSTQAVPGITLPTANSTATVSTQWSSNSCQGCGATTTSYQLNFDVRESDKLPVAVTLTSGPNLINTSGTVAIDLGNNCNDCGNTQLQYSVTLPGGTPKVGDTYDFTVTYSDGSQDTGSTVNAAVTGWDGGSTIVGASDAPTSLAPNDNNSTSTTPTFTWTDSSSATGSDFNYSFYLSDQTTCSGNCTIWQIPGNNSKANGFPSSITSITWGIDPTDSTNTPSVGSLTSGDVYGWSVWVQDPNGNEAQTNVWYQP